MTKNKIEKAIFNYKIVRMIMMGFGAFLVAVGPFYAFFIFQQVGFDGLGEVLWTFIGAVLAFPAGLFICIVGRRIREPILKDEE